MAQSIWHVLDVRAIWIKEFASALSHQVQTLGWLPHISSTAILRNYEREQILEDPGLRLRSFPLQRGFARFPVDTIAREGNRIVRRILRRTEAASQSPLICTTPHYADVAERWPGPVVYYVTDRFVSYGDDPVFINSLDRRMCVRADCVCPNSQRIADYLIKEAQCPEEKVHVVANATREENILDEPPTGPIDLPVDVQDMECPVAGVIGNLAANMDWELLQQTIERTPWLSWVFVGPTEMSVPDPKQKQARQSLIERGGRVRFVGEKPYGVLRNYARALDVAILPYRKREPTYSGSSTRFYEHLAACRPILATRGFEELLHKEPLLKLFETAEQVTVELEELRDAGFRDGNEELRWRASHDQTWDCRAAAMILALGQQAEGKPSEAFRARCA